MIEYENSGLDALTIDLKVLDMKEKSEVIVYHIYNVWHNKRDEVRQHLHTLDDIQNVIMLLNVF